MQTYFFQEYVLNILMPKRKINGVAITLSGKKPVTQVTRDSDINANTLYNMGR